MRSTTMIYQFGLLLSNCKQQKEKVKLVKFERKKHQLKRFEMTEQLVNQKNFSLGCRICRTTIIGSTSYVELSEIMSEFLDGNRVSYSDAFEACTGVQGLDGSDMPKKLW